MEKQNGNKSNLSAERIFASKLTRVIWFSIVWITISVTLYYSSDPFHNDERALLIFNAVIINFPIGLIIYLFAERSAVAKAKNTTIKAVTKISVLCALIFYILIAIERYIIQYISNNNS